MFEGQALSTHLIQPIRAAMVIFALLLGQGTIHGTLFRQEGIGVYLDKPLVSSICLQLCFCLDMETGILE